MYNNLLANYSAFSGWIENLGVVPLLLFSAFLLFPALDFLFALLFLVTRVLETISQLLSLITISRCKFTQFNKIQNLRPSLSLVKGLLTPLCFFFISLSPTVALDTEKQILTKGSTLTIGQLLRINTPNLLKFTVGNKEIVSVKALPKENSLIIKGLGLGHTDLFLWKKGKKTPSRHQVFVVHKAKYLKLKALSLSFLETGLITKIKGKKVHLEGSLENRSDYQTLVHLYNENASDIVLTQVTLSPKLRLTLYGEFLEVLQKHALLDIDCEIKKLFLHCLGSEDVKESLSSLKSQFIFKWVNQKLFTIGHQYRVTLTLQQFESSDGQAFNFGLSKVEGNLGQILFDNPLSIIEENTISLKETSFKSQTLAHPKLTGRLNHPIKVRLGQEIPFLQSVSNGVATQEWRFAGLSIDVLLKPHTDRLLVDFKTNLSQPGENGISQNLQQSVVIVEKGKSQVLFDIGFNIKQNQIEALPLLSKIPLFGSLFKGRSKGETYKKILCLIHIEEIL